MADKIFYKDLNDGIVKSVQVDYSHPVEFEVNTNTTETRMRIVAPAGNSEYVDHIGNEPKPPKNS